MSLRGVIPGTKKSIISVQDITELKEAYRALSEAETKYHVIVENASDAIIVIQDEMIKFANRAATAAYPLEELISKPFYEFIHPDDREKIVELYRETLKGGTQPEKYSARTLGKDGDIRCIEGTGVRIEWEGRPAVLTFLKDVTELKKAEEEKQRLQEQLLHSQKMEAIGRLAGGLAHDFNNLLTVIKGYTQIALLEVDEDSPVRSRLQEIADAADKAASLTRQLLAFSRKQLMEMRIFDLRDEVKKMEKMLKRLIGEDVELVTEISDHECFVRADPVQIEQVVINLAVNARDAMPKGGRLTISVKKVGPEDPFLRSRAFLGGDEYVLLSVSDTGCGIPEEIRDKIFEPFFTTKEPGTGTGLGLSTVYGIVKQLEGHIFVESEVGRGTTFRIYLPASTSPEVVAEEPEEEKKIPPGQGRLLLVEDNDELRELLRSFLENQGYEVLCAKDGKEALRIFENLQRPVDLILTDLVMPYMSGKELVEQARKYQSEVKVLYMSGYVDQKVLDEATQAEGFRFIQKPFGLDVLLKKIRAILEGKGSP